MELDGGEFEKKIYVKKDAGPLLAWDVARKYSYASKASGGTQAEHIAIGTATDPYQPAEREYGVTRACLEELAKREGLSVSIITKSDQIVRDIDVLQRIGRGRTWRLTSPSLRCEPGWRGCLSRVPLGQICGWLR
jgi:DNA repair photolyase